MGDPAVTGETPLPPLLICGWRERLGARLLRRYLARAFWHYNRLAEQHPDEKNRHNCAYIAIGLRYAHDQRTIESARLFRSRADYRGWREHVLNEASTPAHIGRNAPFNG